jgi:hypothetical protein
MDDIAKSIANEITEGPRIECPDLLLKLFDDYCKTLAQWWQQESFCGVGVDILGMRGFMCKFRFKLCNNCQDNKQEYILLDTANNREKLTQLFSKKFPSSTILNWDSFRFQNKPSMLMGVDVHIRNLGEIEKLAKELNTEEVPAEKIK